MKTTVRNMATLFVLPILALTVACAPVPGEVTPAPAPGEAASAPPLAPAEVTPAPTPEEVTPESPSEPTPESTSIGETNFRMLISDDVNAIDHFKSLVVTISNVGVHRGGGSGEWIEFPPATEELDLVPLQEENAQEIWSGALPDGEYTKVFVYVSDVEGVLNSGDSTEVKLPSEKLHLNTHFTIPDDSPISFVFDLSVVAAGNEKSGIKYILKPVVNQSGPNQKFVEVSPPGRERERERITEGKLDLELEGDVAAGETITLLAIFEGEPVAGAEVRVNGENIGQTDQSGAISFTIPEDADELEIEVKKGKLEGELEIELAKEPEEAENSD
ncbi:DUF4382 domain-containing protein [Chloroflexota bacterium]